MHTLLIVSITQILNVPFNTSLVHVLETPYARAYARAYTHVHNSGKQRKRFQGSFWDRKAEK